jgi:hypothetical protein
MGEVAAPTARSFPKIGIVRIGTLLFFDIKSINRVISRQGKIRKSCVTGKVCQSATVKLLARSSQQVPNIIRQGNHCRR